MAIGGYQRADIQRKLLHRLFQPERRRHRRGQLFQERPDLHPFGATDDVFFGGEAHHARGRHVRELADLIGQPLQQLQYLRPVDAARTPVDDRQHQRVAQTELLLDDIAVDQGGVIGRQEGVGAQIRLQLRQKPGCRQAAQHAQADDPPRPRHLQTKKPRQEITSGACACRRFSLVIHYASELLFPAGRTTQRDGMRK